MRTFLFFDSATVHSQCLHRHATFFGLQPPGDTPEIFAPGVVSSKDQLEMGCTITPDGKEFYFCATLGNHDWYGILVTRLVDGKWTEPVVALLFVGGLAAVAGRRWWY